MKTIIFFRFTAYVLLFSLIIHFRSSNYSQNVDRSTYEKLDTEVKIEKLKNAADAINILLFRKSRAEIDSLMSKSSRAHKIADKKDFYGYDFLMYAKYNNDGYYEFAVTYYFENEKVSTINLTNVRVKPSDIFGKDLKMMCGDSIGYIEHEGELLQMIKDKKINGFNIK